MLMLLPWQNTWLLLLRCSAACLLLLYAACLLLLLGDSWLHLGTSRSGSTCATPSHGSSCCLGCKAAEDRVLRTC